MSVASTSALLTSRQLGRSARKGPTSAVPAQPGDLHDQSSMALMLTNSSHNVDAALQAWIVAATDQLQTSLVERGLPADTADVATLSIRDAHAVVAAHSQAFDASIHNLRASAGLLRRVKQAYDSAITRWRAADLDAPQLQAQLAASTAAQQASEAKRVAQLNQQAANQAARIAALTRELEQAHARVQSQASQIAELEDEAQHLQAAVVDAKAHTSEVLAAYRRSEVASLQKEQRVQELTRETVTSRAMVKAMEGETESLTREAEILRARMRSMAPEAELTRRTRQNHLLASELADQKRANQNLRRELQQMVSMVSGRMRQVEAQSPSASASANDQHQMLLAAAAGKMQTWLSQLLRALGVPVPVLGAAHRRGRSTTMSSTCTVGFAGSDDEADSKAGSEPGSPPVDDFDESMLQDEEPAGPPAMVPFSAVQDGLKLVLRLKAAASEAETASTRGGRRGSVRIAPAALAPAVVRGMGGQAAGDSATASDIQSIAKPRIMPPSNLYRDHSDSDSDAGSSCSEQARSAQHPSVAAGAVMSSMLASISSALGSPAAGGLDTATLQRLQKSKHASSIISDEGAQAGVALAATLLSGAAITPQIPVVALQQQYFNPLLPYPLLAAPGGIRSDVQGPDAPGSAGLAPAAMLLRRPGASAQPRMLGVSLLPPDSTQLSGQPGTAPAAAPGASAELRVVPLPAPQLPAHVSRALACQDLGIGYHDNSTADPRLAPTPLPVPLSALPFRHRFYVGLGTHASIPRYLRAHGMLRHRNLNKRATERLIKQCWMAKSQAEAALRRVLTTRAQSELSQSAEDAHGTNEDLQERFSEAIEQHAHIPLASYLFTFMMQRTGGTPGIAVEWCYNFVDALQRYVYDADVEMFLRILQGRLPEIVHDQSITMLNALTDDLIELDRSVNGGQAAGVLPRVELVGFIRRSFRAKHDDAVQELLSALHGDPKAQADPIEYAELLAEDANGDQGPFAETLRDQFLAEYMEFSSELTAAIASNAVRAPSLAAAIDAAAQAEAGAKRGPASGSSGATLPAAPVAGSGPMQQYIMARAAAAGIRRVDPEKPDEELVSYVARGLGLPGSAEDLKLLTSNRIVPLEDFLRRLRRQWLERSSRRSGKLYTGRKV